MQPLSKISISERKNTYPCWSF